MARSLCYQVILTRFPPATHRGDDSRSYLINTWNCPPLAGLRTSSLTISPIIALQLPLMFLRVTLLCKETSSSFIAMSRFITIDFSAIDNILSEFGAIKDRAADLKPVASTVALVISSYTDDVFANAPRTQSGGTASNGFVWDRLKPATLKANNGRRSNGQILRDTGALLNSLQSNSTSVFSPRNAANFFAAGSDSIEFGTNLPQGFNNKTRPFLAHTDSLTDLVAKAIENYILTGET